MLPPSPPKNYKISSAFSYNFRLALTLSDRYIVVRYALPQAVISIVPTFMQMMGMCMAGSAIVENIFSLPGLGYRIVDSLTNRDLPVIYATVLFLAFALVIFNILADIIQRLLQTRKGGAA